MSPRLTPDMPAGAYEFLRITEPFKAWKLPSFKSMAARVCRAHGFDLKTRSSAGHTQF